MKRALPFSEKRLSAAVRRRAFAAHFRDFTGLGRSSEDALLFMLVASVFLSWLLTIVTVLSLSVWILSDKKRLLRALRPHAASCYLFGVLTWFFLVSLLRKNVLSALAMIGIALFVLVSFWVRSFMTRRRYERLLDLSLAMSFFCAADSFYQKSVQPAASRASYLVCGPTTNANYYGLLLMMLILTALFRLLQTGWKKDVLFYGCSILVNFVCLVLSESVASIAGLLLGVLLLLFLYRHYKTLAVLMGTLSSVFTLGCFLPSSPWNGSILYPILERMELWKIAWRSTCDSAQNFFFGQGLFSFQELWNRAPHSFWNVRGVVPREFQPHAHNLVVEIFLSVGFFGFLLLIGYAVYQGMIVRRRARCLPLRSNSLFLLVVFASILFANLADVSVFWVQTGFWFFLLCSCVGIPSE